MVSKSAEKSQQPTTFEDGTYFIDHGFCGSDPSGIKVTNKSAKSIHVAWDTTKINCGYTITGYTVYFNSLSPFKTYKKKTVSGATTDNVEIFPIIPGFSYTISVKALTVNGAVSNPTFINYTHPHTKPSAAPSNIHASTKGITSLTISWDAVDIFHKNGDVKGYKVYYRGPGLAGTKSANVIGESNRQFTVSGLRPNATYQFILQVVNDVGPGNYSGFIPITTLPLPTTTTTTTTPMPTTTTVTTTTTTTQPTTTTTTPTTTTTQQTTTTTQLTTTTTQPTTTTTQKPTKPTTPTTTTQTTTRTTKVITPTKQQSKLSTSTTQVTALEEPEKDTNNILLMVGIAAGALIFLAVLIPLVVFMCRNCCLKGAVSPDQEEEEVKNKIKKKEAFRPLDENENKTVTKYDRRMSTDTLLSIDNYDIDEVNDTRKVKSRHRRLSKRALSYTDDKIAEDAKQVQNNVQVDKVPIMRVESIQEVKEPDHHDDKVFIDDNEIRQAKSDGEANSLTDKPQVTSNIYVLNANIQTKIFTSKKSRISPNFEKDFSFMHDAIKDESSLHDPNVRSATAFNVIKKPAQTTPRVVLFEPW
ncbi:mucin-2-like [Mytilus trossulus]|uniref:mucin-2-like n=1 Tax=Mytilus trossulus TaxID=6551 RepID=UPI003007B9C5